MVESGIFYSNVLDPILVSVRKRLAQEILPGQRVIDIACGTGAQLREISSTAAEITGIDLSESMIAYAKKTADQQGLTNADFRVANATDLSSFKDSAFDVALMSLALHQFSPQLYPSLLLEMKRVAKTCILLDYTVPLPVNVVGIGSRIAEFLAGREHHRNFRAYYTQGGLSHILPAQGFVIKKSAFLAKRAFHLVVAESL